MGLLKCQIIVIFLFYYLIIAQPNFSLRCNVTEYPPNGTYHTNLNTLVSSLSRNIDSDGFYNATIGQDQDRISAIAQCRADVELQACRNCITNASRLILEKCPSKKSAFEVYDVCLIRYSNESFIGTMSTDPRSIYYILGDFSNPKLFFNQYLAPVLTSLRTRASAGGKHKFAANVFSAPDFQTIHALVQCTSDLSAQSCYACLTAIYSSLPDCECYAKMGNYYIMPSCIVRYEPYSFFNELLLAEAPPPLLSPPQTASLPPPPPPGKADKTARTIIIIVVLAVTVVIFVVCIPVILMKRRKRKLVYKRESIRDYDTSSAESLQYDFSTIRAATDNFSNDNKLGQGGFGPVYKGKLSNGQEVAVKRLAANSGQGDLEFKNEVLLVAKLEHRNLVRLFGFCFDGTERLLIYEFVPNASLDHFLFDPVKRKHLDWERRSKIIGGIARGILYLHEDSRHRIIHRDLKASNVLLDAEMNPKISDFGMARLFAMDESQGITSKIAGTYGYMAPEYAMQGKMSVKSDVFSFGVLVLEILGGQRNTCFINGEYVGNLLSYAWRNWREGTTSNLIDPVLRGSSGLVSDITRCIHIALLCVQENVSDRPTMAAVVLMLSSLSLALSVPSKPGYYMQINVSPNISPIQGYKSKLISESNQPAKSKSICLSQNEMSIISNTLIEQTAMGSLKWLIILIIQFYYLFYLTIAQPNFTFQSPCEGNVTEYPPNGTYHTNLNTLLSSLSRNIDSNGFYNATVGQDQDRVSAIAQCRADAELQTCRNCINNATRLILEKCPSKKSAFGIYDMCLIRYSNESFIGTMSTDPRFIYYVLGNFSFPQYFFNQYLAPVLTSLRTRASVGGKRKFAANVFSSPDFQTIHALVQCTADLSAQGCYDCLSAVYKSLPDCECYAKWGNYHLMPSCIVRYEPYPFFNESLLTEAPPPLLSPPEPALLQPPPGKDDKTARTVIIILVPIVTIVILIGCISVILMRRRKRKLVNRRELVEGISMEDDSIAESLQYDFSAISAATDNFSDANKLGQGGFGPVYKGKLPNGQEVAVKRLSIDSGQGDLEFKNEVLLVARLQHRNLVRLRGFCFDGTERLLVYEFVPNASLDHFLFDPVKRRQLDWERRSKIIGGVARGILYLHEDSRLRIIHRDLKASNVLLDAEMNPKISDFGMARLFTLDETQGSTTRIVGTYGYMAPEYAMHGQFSVKSDVFSIGVLVLEILSGQKNTYFRNGEYVEDLLSYAWKNWREGTATNLIDPMLRGSSGLVRDIMRYIHIALLCIQENIGDRPTMAAVVLMLSSLALSLPVPSGPSYYTHNDISPEISLIKEYNSRSSEPRELAKNKSISSSRNEASITELYPR
ncbi:hypothetical protein RDI58_005368 [Solanum bulbocastanum]|uniref:Uncharacterized protein n=1 Tax=Solanum bulbocastanum TaxID=147425 RepID=A0AAN8YMI7_SOLBU